MKYAYFIILFFFISTTIVVAQQLPAYAIYDKNGKPATFAKMVKAASQSKAIFFGELHNNTIAHWLELELLKALHSRDSTLVLGLEMFEADDQLVLDEYLQGLIDERNFLNEVKLWDNYATDYQPLVEFARENNLKVIATNIPRRYASLVYKKGMQVLDGLPEAAKATMAPLPILVDLELPGYKSMVSDMGGHAAGSATNLASSQAVKDATMAHFIYKNLTSKFLHINGSYHSQNREGIVWYLKQQAAEVKTITIQTVEQPTILKLNKDNKQLADYIICVPESMTKSF